MDFLYLFFIIVASAIIGGIVYRWRGGGEPVGWGKYMPRPLDQILFSVPYIALAFYVLPLWSAGILSLITVAFVSKGHGRNMDLGTFDNSLPPGGVKPEWYEGIIDGLYGKIPEYWYDALGLAVSGLTYTIPVGLFIADPAGGYFWEGLFLALSGALKAPAYMLGRWLDDNGGDPLDDFEDQTDGVVTFDGPTSWGEFLTGFFLWAGAAAVGWFIVF